MNGVKTSGLNRVAIVACLGGVFLGGALMFACRTFAEALMEKETPAVTLLKSDRVEARLERLEDLVEQLLARKFVEAAPDWEGVADVVSAADGGEVVIEKGDMKIVVDATRRLMEDASEGPAYQGSGVPSEIPIDVGTDYVPIPGIERYQDDFVEPKVGGAYLEEQQRIMDAFSVEVRRLSESGLEDEELKKQVKALEAQLREDLRALVK